MTTSCGTATRSTRRSAARFFGGRRRIRPFLCAGCISASRAADSARKALCIAAGVRMHALGGAAEGLMDFGCRKPAVERQAQHLAMAFVRRQRLGSVPRRPNFGVGKLVQHVADHAKPAPRHHFRHVILRIGGGIADGWAAPAIAAWRRSSASLAAAIAGDDMRDLGPVRPFRLPEPIHRVLPFADMPVHRPSKTECVLRASNDRMFWFPTI